MPSRRCCWWPPSWPSVWRHCLRRRSAEFDARDSDRPLPIPTLIHGETLKRTVRRYAAGPCPRSCTEKSGCDPGEARLSLTSPSTNERGGFGTPSRHYQSLANGGGKPGGPARPPPRADLSYWIGCEEGFVKAAVFHGDGVLRIEERPEPGVEAPDDVIVAVEACGVCGTDIQILNVPPGHPADPGGVMGHEFIGRIAAAGSEAQAAGLRAGQRVAVDPDPKCGVCRYCRAGRPANCLNIRALGIFRDGALTSLVKAPANAVFPLADGPRMEGAALIEPLAF